MEKERGGAPDAFMMTFQFRNATKQTTQILSSVLICEH